VISDSNVFPIYGNILENSLTSSGFRVCHYVFSAGESQKNSTTYLEILNFLAENTFTRSDMIIALGGGVTGDIAGFAAATYLRGIPYVQIPTSLLAMVDSSVGGKTAIDLPAGKNLAGAFYQPKLVLCDPGVLNTLPEEIFRDGCAEIIKYGILYDPQLFDHLMEKGLGFDREAVISRCIELKRDVVKEDEFDTGARQKLNLGHTIGHGIEKQSNYAVSHGQAVAIGMAIIAKAAASKGLCSMSLLDDVCRILDLFQLPRSTELSATELYESALSDKKRAGGTVNLIVPRHIGDCLICPTPVAEMKSFIEAGM
jgi:3-dehydroquinate synthase